MNMIYKFFPVILLTALSACTTVPETGRSGLSLVSDSEVSALAAQEFSKMKSSMKISTDKKNAERLKTIGVNIVKSARINAPSLPLPEAWEFVLFEDSQVNAFAMPGGKVGFYTGMLKVAQSDEEIAVILGHEVAHVSAKHSAERMSYEMLKQVSALGLAFGLNSQSAATQELAMAAFGLGTEVGVMLPFSRSDESEADKMGLIYAARAGYNPEVAPAFWKKMSASGGGKPMEFLSTHPSDETRIKNLTEQMPDAKIIYEASKKTK